MRKSTSNLPDGDDMGTGIAKTIFYTGLAVAVVLMGVGLGLLAVALFILS